MQMHNNNSSMRMRMSILHSLNCPASRNKSSLELELLDSEERQHASSSIFFLLSTTSKPWTAWRALSSYRVLDFIQLVPASRYY